MILIQQVNTGGCPVRVAPNQARLHSRTLGAADIAYEELVRQVCAAANTLASTTMPKLRRLLLLPQLTDLMNMPALRRSEVFERSPALQTMAFVALEQISQRVDGLVRGLRNTQVGIDSPIQIFQQKLLEAEMAYADLFRHGFSSPSLFGSIGGDERQITRREYVDLKIAMTDLLDGESNLLRPYSLMTVHKECFAGIRQPLSESEVSQLTSYIDVLTLVNKGHILTLGERLEDHREGQQIGFVTNPIYDRGSVQLPPPGLLGAASTYENYDVHIVILTEEDAVTRAAAEALAKKYPGKTMILNLAGVVLATDRVTDTLMPQVGGRIKVQVLGHGRMAGDGHSMTIGGRSAAELAAKVPALIRSRLHVSLAQQLLKTSFVACGADSVTNTNHEIERAFVRDYIEGLPKDQVSIADNYVSIFTAKVAVDDDGRKYVLSQQLAPGAVEVTQAESGVWVTTENEKIVYRYSSSSIQPVGYTPATYSKMDVLSYIANKEHENEIYHHDQSNLEIVVLDNNLLDHNIHSSRGAEPFLLAHHTIRRNHRALFVVITNPLSGEGYYAMMSDGDESSSSNPLKTIGVDEAKNYVRQYLDTGRNVIDLSFSGHGLNGLNNGSGASVFIVNRDIRWGPIANSILDNLGLQDVIVDKLHFNACYLGGYADENHVMQTNPKFLSDLVTDLYQGHHVDVKRTTLSASGSYSASGTWWDRGLSHVHRIILKYDEPLQRKLMYVGGVLRQPITGLSGEVIGYEFYVEHDGVIYIIGGVQCVDENRPAYVPSAEIESIDWSRQYNLAQLSHIVGTSLLDPNTMVIGGLLNYKLDGLNYKLDGLDKLDELLNQQANLTQEHHTALQALLDKQHDSLTREQGVALQELLAQPLDQRVNVSQEQRMALQALLDKQRDLLVDVTQEQSAARLARLGRDDIASYPGDPAHLRPLDGGARSAGEDALLAYRQNENIRAFNATVDNILGTHSGLNGMHFIGYSDIAAVDTSKGAAPQGLRLWFSGDRPDVQPVSVDITDIANVAELRKGFALMDNMLRLGPDATDVAGGADLFNGGMLVMMLMHLNALSEGGKWDTVNPYVKAQVLLGVSQGGLQLVSDVASTINSLRALKAVDAEALSPILGMGSRLGHVAGAAGLAAGVASTALDIKFLVDAINSGDPDHVALSAAQVGIDGVSLGLSAAPFIMGLLGVASAGSDIAGAVAVPLIGLGIGAMGLASVIVHNQEIARRNIGLLHQIANGYSDPLHIAAQPSGSRVLVIAKGATVNRVDFRTGMVGFAADAIGTFDQYNHQADRGSSPGDDLPLWELLYPQRSAEARHTAVHMDSDERDPLRPFLLFTTPTLDVDYTAYNHGSVSDSLVDTLQTNSRDNPKGRVVISEGTHLASDWTVRMYWSTLDVVLDNRSRILVLPNYMAEETEPFHMDNDYTQDKDFWIYQQDLVGYHIDGGGGSCVLVLRTDKDASGRPQHRNPVRIDSANKEDNWIIALDKGLSEGGHSFSFGTRDNAPTIEWNGQVIEFNSLNGGSVILIDPSSPDTQVLVDIKSKQLLLQQTLTAWTRDFDPFTAVKASLERLSSSTNIFAQAGPGHYYGEVLVKVPRGGRVMTGTVDVQHQRAILIDADTVAMWGADTTGHPVWTRRALYGRGAGAQAYVKNGQYVVKYGASTYCNGPEYVWSADSGTFERSMLALTDVGYNELVTWLASGNAFEGFVARLRELAPDLELGGPDGRSERSPVSVAWNRQVGTPAGAGLAGVQSLSLIDGVLTALGQSGNYYRLEHGALSVALNKAVTGAYMLAADSVVGELLKRFAPGQRLTEVLIDAAGRPVDLEGTADGGYDITVESDLVGDSRGGITLDSRFSVNREQLYRETDYVVRQTATGQEVVVAGGYLDRTRVNVMSGGQKLDPGQAKAPDDSRLLMFNRPLQESSLRFLVRDGELTVSDADGFGAVTFDDIEAVGGYSDSEREEVLTLRSRGADGRWVDVKWTTEHLFRVALRALNPEATKGLTSADIDGMDDLEVRSLAGAGLQAAQLTLRNLLGHSLFSLLGDDQLRSLSVAAVEGLTPAQLAGLSARQLALLQPAAVGGLSEAQLSALSPTQVLSLTTRGLKNHQLSVHLHSGGTVFGALSASSGGLIGLDADTVAGLGADEFVSLSDAAVRALDVSRLNAWQMNMRSASSTLIYNLLRAEQVGSLPDSVITATDSRGSYSISGLTSAQLAGLTSRQVRLLTSEQLQRMSDDQLRALDAAGLDVGRLKVLGASGKTVFDIITGHDAPDALDALGRLTPETISQLDPHQLMLLSDQQIQALNAGGLYPERNLINVIPFEKLSNLQLSELTADAVAALPVNVFAGLDAHRVSALNPTKLLPGQLLKINTAVLGLLGSNWFNNLNPTPQVFGLLNSEVASCLSLLPESTVRGLSADFIRRLTPEGIEHLAHPEWFSAAAVGALSSQQLVKILQRDQSVHALDGNWFNALKTRAVAGLGDEQFRGYFSTITQAVYQKLDAGFIHGLTPTQVGMLVHPEWLPADAVSALSQQQLVKILQRDQSVHALDGSWFNALSTKAVAELDDVQFRGYFSTITQAVYQKLDAGFIHGLTPAQMGILQATWLNSLGAEAIGALTPLQLGALPLEVFHEVSPDFVAALSPSTIGLLCSPSGVWHLQPSGGGTAPVWLGAAWLNELSASAVGKLSVTQLTNVRAETYRELDAGFYAAVSSGVMAHKDALLSGTAADDELSGTVGVDTLHGYDGADHISGMGGDDTLYGDAGDDRLEGGDGIDQLNGGDGNDELRGGSGVDILMGESGNDTLYGDSGNDRLYGGAGNNIFDGGTGDDVLVADGAGDNTFRFGKGAGLDNIVNHDTVDTSRDKVTITGASPESLWFRREGDNLEINILGGGATLSIGHWFDGSENQVGSFEVDDGRHLLAGQVNALVSAMAAFSPPPASQSVLPDDYRLALSPVIAANWK